MFPVLDEISSWFSLDIPRMLLHYFQIITHFLFVCQSVNWLTSLMKLGKYRDISCPWDIFMKIFGGISGMFLHFSNNYKFLLCLSVLQLPNFLILGWPHENKAWKSPFKGIFSAAFALWENAGVYILLPLLTYLLPQFLTDLITYLIQKKSWKYMSILMLGLWNLICSIPGHNH